jgi:integration host factor subunit alpha
MKKTGLNDEDSKPSLEKKSDEAAGALTRADLADAVHAKLGLPKAEAAQCVEMVLNEIVEAIVAREPVKLSSFGAFSVRAKRERRGRNPKTGIDAKISARLVVTFRPSNILRARVNGDKPLK